MFFGGDTPPPPPLLGSKDICCIVREVGDVQWISLFRVWQIPPPPLIGFHQAWRGINHGMHAMLPPPPPPRKISCVSHWTGIFSGETGTCCYSLWQTLDSFSTRPIFVTACKINVSRQGHPRIHNYILPSSSQKCPEYLYMSRYRHQ